MTQPVMQKANLIEEIGRREAEQEYAARTAGAALARQMLLQSYKHSRWAAFGAVAGCVGIIGSVTDVIAPDGARLLWAIGIASAVWLMTDRWSRQAAISDAEKTERLARSARRRLDQFYGRGA
jgi:hypothetical protein